MLDFWEFGKTGGNFECFQHNGMSYFGNWEFGNWEIPNTVLKPGNMLSIHLTYNTTHKVTMISPLANENRE